MELKANFDATYDRATFISGSGVVLRNSKGQVLASKAVYHFDVGSAFIAEAPVCTGAVKMCVDLDLQDITVEGDSLTIIKKCQSNTRDRFEISRLIRNTKILINDFCKIKFQHTLRMRNRLAGSLTRECLKIRETFYLLGRVLDFSAQIQVDESIQELH